MLMAVLVLVVPVFGGEGGYTALTWQIETADSSRAAMRRFGMTRYVIGAKRVGLGLSSSSSGGGASSTDRLQQSAPAGVRRQKVANPLNELLDEAQRDMDKKDFAAAVEPLQKFIAEQPDVAYGHFQLAYAFTALHKTAEARAEYERALAIDPKMAEAYLNLGVLLIDSDAAASVTNLRKGVDLLPAQSHPRYLLGVAQERAGDFAGAAESFEGAYRLDPKNPEPIVYLANLYLRLKRFPDAEAKLRIVLETQPKDGPAMLGLAECLDAEKKAEAADAYRAYLAVQPGDPGARARLVHLLVEHKQYDVALAELDRADADAGGGTSAVPNLDSLRLRAEIQVAQKKWDDAVVTLNQAIALAANDGGLHGELGRIYLQRRDFAGAQKELKIALQTDRKNLDYWKDLSSSYYLAGDCASTLAVLEEIAKMETPGAGPWFIRALCYDKLNQPKPALEAYQTFLSLDQGTNADQVWQAQERSKVLRKALEHKR
jgi:superkiller protein 3